jgi:hypothetical protein
VQNRYFVGLCVFILTAVCAAAQRDAGPSSVSERLLGTWSGTWDGGGGSGGFELTLERQKDAPISGQVSVTGDPEYKTTLKTVSFDGRKMTATYDFPQNTEVEIILGATFEEESATGTWLAREKATGNELANGGWKVTRKPR